jgi:phospholipase C
MRTLRVGPLALAIVVILAGCTHSRNLGNGSAARARTPIQHLVVIYLENQSFDHYFGTYPNAANPPGEPAFHAKTGTPRVNGLTTALLTRNPNGVNPRRLDRSDAFTCDNDHGYSAEQRAFDGGRMDRFVSATGPGVSHCAPSSVMDYYDGNTVTALWNYAQRFAMSDNSHDATFGPTLPGHLNLVAGQTHGAVVSGGRTGAVRNATVLGNVSAQYEDCAHVKGVRVAMSGRNIGDLLTSGGVGWGYFSEGFRATLRGPDGTAVCASSHRNGMGKTLRDYYAGGIVEPFQFWASTANPHHVPPASSAEIGRNGRANHQYDLTDFWRAADARRLPAVSFIKPAAYDNGHPGNSSPLDEQRFLVNTVNRIQSLPTWSSTAIIVAYDDSDGWYDHQMAAILNSSHDTGQDALSGPGSCGSAIPLGGYLDRCGPGPRQPFLVISPYAKRNAVDHSLTTQVSITRFIEDNWLRGQRLGSGSFDASAGTVSGLFDFAHPARSPLFLNPASGLVCAADCTPEEPIDLDDPS